MKENPILKLNLLKIDFREFDWHLWRDKKYNWNDVRYKKKKELTGFSIEVGLLGTSLLEEGGKRSDLAHLVSDCW
jgi:hypothetical protein